MISFLVYLPPGAWEHLEDRRVSELCIPSAQQSLAHEEEKEVWVPHKMSGPETGTFIYLTASKPRLPITITWGVLETAKALTPHQTN